jgi:hypothetical protein
VTVETGQKAKHARVAQLILKSVMTELIMMVMARLTALIKRIAEKTLPANINRWVVSEKIHRITNSE